jgi:acetoacetate decarboxylase
MGYKHRSVDADSVAQSLGGPNFLLKIIPHVDGAPRICELVRYHMIDIVMKGAWESPAALELFSHVACDVARLPVREVISGAHFVADLTLDLGEVVFDYLAEK